MLRQFPSEAHPRTSVHRRRCSRLPHRHRPGLAAMEVVIATGMIIPTLMFLLYHGLKAMAAFLSLLGTMLGSPLG